MIRLLWLLLSHRDRRCCGAGSFWLFALPLDAITTADALSHALDPGERGCKESGQGSRTIWPPAWLAQAS
jgi:hypothetical protein